jgi:repressor LexA
VYMQHLLTFKQQKVLDSIRAHFEKWQEPPTLEQLRQKLGFASLRTVAQYMDILERKGYIVRRKNAWRNIELRNADGGWGTVSIPVVANVGCDDLSVFAEEQHDEFIEVDKQIVEENGEIVAVRAVGESMLDAGIHSGDYILVQFTNDVKNGDRVAAIVGDMVTVKRYEKKDGVIILYPESKDPKYKPIILKDNFKITGKVLCIIPANTYAPSEIVPIRGEE